MSDIFDIENEMPVLKAEARLIRPFARLISRDRGSEGDAQGRKKMRAMKELAFIYFKYSMKSNFREHYRGAELDKQIKTHLDLPEDWREDEIVKEASHFYVNDNKSLSSETLETAISSLFLVNSLLKKYQNQLNDVMEKEVSLETEADKKLEDERVKFFLDSIKKIIDLSNSIPKAITSLEELKVKVDKEVESTKFNKKEVDETELPGFLNG